MIFYDDFGFVISIFVIEVDISSSGGGSKACRIGHWNVYTQSEIDQEKAKVKKLAEHFTAKELVELVQIFLAKSSELMSVSQGPNDGKNFSSIDDTSTILGNLISLAYPGIGTFNANWILD